MSDVICPVCGKDITKGGCYIAEPPPPELGSGALREALEWALTKIEFPLVPDPNDENHSWKGCPGCRVIWTRDMVHGPDCSYVNALALSLSSPIEPSRHELADADAVECKNCGLGIGYWPSQPECKPAPTSQASSEIREASEKLSIQQVREMWHQSLTDNGSLNIVTFTFKLNEASRQGAGGK